MFTTIIFIIKNPTNIIIIIIIITHSLAICPPVIKHGNGPSPNQIWRLRSLGNSSISMGDSFQPATFDWRVFIRAQWNVTIESTLW